MPDIEVLKWAVGQGGGYVLAIVVLLLYRKDHIDKQTALKDGHERRDHREDRLLAIIERHATAAEALVGSISKLDETLGQHHLAEAAWTERLTKELGELSHDVKSTKLVLDRMRP